MKKMKFYAMAFAAMFAVAFSSCQPQTPEPDPDPDPTPEVTELSLDGMLVITYRGQSMSDEVESYTAAFTNEKTQEQYSVELASYPNALAGPVEGTYAVAASLDASEQIAITKVIGETEVEAESGTVEIKGNAAEMEFTFNITLADGETENLHYKGAVTVQEYDYAGASEPTTPISVTFKPDTAIYAFYPADGEYSAQSQVLMVDNTNGFEVEFFMFFQSAANSTAQTQPTGTFALNLEPSGTDDFLQVGDYYMYLYYQQMGYYPPFAAVSAFEGSSYTAIFFPQTGNVEITAAEGEAFNVKINNWVSYNGSTFSGEFVAQKYVEPAGAPMRMAPKYETKWNMSLFNKVQMPSLKLARK